MSTSAPRGRVRIKGAADYDEAAYWDTKFATGKDAGEWLNSGDILIDAALSELNRRPHPDATPRVLHLGPGISTLGTRLCELFQGRGWPGSCIVNADFSAEAVRLGREQEARKEQDQAMKWIQVDLRSWGDVAGLCPHGPFDVLLDKSTSDAIATSPTMTLSALSDKASLCPSVREIVERNGELTLSPVELLALHLVPLTLEGATWIALSYSSTRFDNLTYAGKYWNLVSRTPMTAPKGETFTSAYTPEVFHWAYVLRRT
ncbi:uncharacterized protein ACLA_063580 [Aspergillus clavatus NRRL 1]|uniref:Methyltransferase domain-containing protein n=1 Tax=Aspergillus clavatus (strain ATCC 1007 / CBS 513.65 / DSM 816 / NCTC 3887 / NRRL 1 / QM 1276 / 107) TaxID=344612 RepID=A1CCY3_ASPCL|nr:uncharacterized protein ACLA_063580 [Aspergillus clavatus NRRL 1]EAW12390.1 conserved hypothetical protein [Aspergillus clavatus NRRL 1]